MVIKHGAGVALLALLMPGAALSHHSLSMYDRQQDRTISGTVKEFEWVNPHCWIHLLVQKPDGSFEEWAFEGGSPGRMSNNGWSNTSLKPGDKITVAYNPHRDGAIGGLFQTVMLPDGTELQAMGPHGGGPRPPTN